MPYSNDNYGLWYQENEALLTTHVPGEVNRLTHVFFYVERSETYAMEIVPLWCLLLFFYQKEPQNIYLINGSR